MKNNLAEKSESSSTAKVIQFPRDKMEPIKNPLDQKLHGKTIRNHIREFAGVFSLILLVLAGIKIYKAVPSNAPYVMIGAAALLMFSGYFAPNALKPLWQAFMWLGKKMEPVMTVVILGVGWCLMFIPVGLILKACGKKGLVTGFKEPVETYWETVKEGRDDFKYLERQF